MTDQLRRWEGVLDAVLASPRADQPSGMPIGHALHPVLTNFPLGAWTSAALLDLFGGSKPAGPPLAC